MVRDIVEKLANPYDRAARLYPALLMLLPLPVLFVCLYGTKNLLWSSLISILSFCGVAYALGRVARDAGKRLEAGLFEQWGGAPSTQLLRHRHDRYDPVTKARFHTFLAAAIAQPFPSEQSEKDDPEKADILYRASTTWLIGQTRDQKKFDLIFKENVAFGFQRNALGLRHAGIVICVVALLWAALHDHVLSFKPPYLDVSKALYLPESTLVTVAVSVVMLVLWLFVFTFSAVKRVGFAYAERLIESCDKLAPNPVAAPPATHPVAATPPKSPKPRRPRPPSKRSKPKPESESESAEASQSKSESEAELPTEAQSEAEPNEVARDDERPA